MNREAVYAALFTKLQAIREFTTVSRHFKLWADLQPEQKPALYMLQRGDEYARNESTPAVITLNVELFVYTAAPTNDSAIPACQMNQLLDAIDAALKPPPNTTVQTLGGLVIHCWIDGKVLVDTGEFDGQGVAVVPLKILAPT